MCLCPQNDDGILRYQLSVPFFFLRQKILFLIQYKFLTKLHIPQSFYVFLYLTTISKGANKAPDLASTHMETNITHLTPPCRPGKKTTGTNAWASSFTIPSGTGFWGRSVKGGSVHSEKLWSPGPQTETSFSPFHPLLSPFFFVILYSFLSLSFWLFPPASHLFVFTSSKVAPKRQLWFSVLL